MKSLLLILSLVAITLAPGFAVSADRVVLVIGINDFPQDENFPDLKNSVNDAALMEKTLRSVGFKVIRAEGANLSELNEILKKFEERIQKGDIALVYSTKSLTVKPTGNAGLMAKLAEIQVEIEQLKKLVEADKVKRPAPQGLTPKGGTFSVEHRMAGNRAGETRMIAGIEMQWCPPTGEHGFLMGSPLGESDRDYDDEKQHRVVLTRGFWLAKTECTQGQWKAAMNTTPAEQKAKGNSFGDVNGTGSRHPMYFVSWEDAMAYCEKLNREQPLPTGWAWTLPTEAQREYACRAWTKTPFHFGGILNGEEANVNGNHSYGTNENGPNLGETIVVGSYEENAWGLQDMHGNVSEWCLDWYGESYYQDKQRDPAGPNIGVGRATRGGGWGNYSQFCRSADRYGYSPEKRSYYLGFRVAVSFIQVD